MIAYGSLYPWHFAAADLPASPVWILFHSWPFDFDRFFLRDIIVNVAIYIPAGLTGHLAFRRFGKPGVNIGAPILICALWSASIEMTQLFVPTRHCSAVDLLTNVLGSAIGVCLAILLEDVLLHYPASGVRRDRTDRAALLLLALWVLEYLFPLFPVLGRTELGEKLEVFLNASVFEVTPFLSAVLMWLVAGTLFRAGGFRPSSWFTAASVALIPAQFFIVHREPSRAELAGAIAGAVCFAFLWPKRTVFGDMCWKVLAWAFLAAIAIRGLTPFQFFNVRAQFLWLPFGGFLNMEWQASIQVLAEKSYWYGTAIWLMRASGVRSRAALTVVVAVVLLIEIAQMRVPGHTPEITDPLWAAVMGWVVFIAAPVKSATRASAA